MDIVTKTVTTRTHTATATPEMLKGVAIGAVKKQLGLTDDAVASSEATLGADGSITVEVVEVVEAGPKVGEPSTPEATIPMGIV